MGVVLFIIQPNIILLSTRHNVIVMTQLHLFHFYVNNCPRMSNLNEFDKLNFCLGIGKFFNASTLEMNYCSSLEITQLIFYQ